MKLNSRKLSLGCLAAFALLFAVSTPAQRLQGPTKNGGARAANPNATGAAKAKVKSDAVHGDATETCTYTFTSGSGETYLKFCVTVNGNIVEFQAPAGIEQIDQAGSYEGYGICDGSTSIGYYDYAYADSGNWNAPTTVSHTATPVKIARTTSDGAWTLTQTITSMPGPNPYAKIAMALKNNSGETKSASLMRYAKSLPVMPLPWTITPKTTMDRTIAHGATLRLTPAPLALRVHAPERGEFHTAYRRVFSRRVCHHRF